MIPDLRTEKRDFAAKSNLRLLGIKVLSILIKIRKVHFKAALFNALRALTNNIIMNSGVETSAAKRLRLAIQTPLLPIEIWALNIASFLKRSEWTVVKRSKQGNQSYDERVLTTLAQPGPCWRRIQHY